MVDSCRFCPEPELNVLKLGGVLMGFMIYSGIMIKSTLGSVFDDAKLKMHSILLKILSNHMQVLGMVYSFNLF